LTRSKTVFIKQKTSVIRPSRSSNDALSPSSPRARLVEINTRLRTDESLQRALVALVREQSVVQQTLNACTPRNVVEMQQALNLIFRRHSKAYRHTIGDGGNCSTST
jgi:hypothetical protein